MKTNKDIPVGTFYHGITRENWEKAQKEGVLQGVVCASSRCTYLTHIKEEAKSYGDVLLQVKYRPNGIDDSYIDGCWQFRVYVPILLKDVTELK